MFKRKHRCFFFVTVLFLSACANVVAPTGGARDVTPPMVVEAKPENHSAFFTGSKIQVTFDEYVTLNNATRELLVSPPLTTKPDVKLSGKTVTVKFKETLKPNTTYTIDFGAAIKDLHEGNQFKDYHYTFATGAVLDTLTLSGKVLLIETEKPATEFLVGLYMETDSVFHLPLQRAPDYVAKTDKDGAFTFYGLPDTCFFVTALEDMNSNLFHDLPNEQVAFIDTLVAPSDLVTLTLCAFTEADTTQGLLESKLVDEGLLRFVFRQPATNVQITCLDTLPTDFKNDQMWSANHDTLCWYFTPGVRDSLKVMVHCDDDTLINKVCRFDLHYKGSKLRGKRDAHVIKVSNNLKNNLLMPGEDLMLRFTEPVVDIRFHDTSTFVAGADTTYNAMRFERADANGFEYCLVETFADTVSYAINMADSVFHSIRGRTNAAFRLKFKRATAADLGSIIIKVCPPTRGQYVVQLLNNKGSVVDQQVVTAGRKAVEVVFRQLVPGKYKLQAIIDADSNGRWSTGNLRKHTLPETIVPYDSELDVKPGWDIAPDDPWSPR